MKQVNPNLSDVVVSRYISNLGQLRKLARYWGTETVDGIEVFTPRKEYYPDIDDSTVKVCKLLNIYNQVKVKQQGIRSAWLTLTPEKTDDSVTEWNRTIITNNLNKSFSKDLYCSVVIGPRLVKRKQVPAPITTPISDQAGLIVEIKSKYLQLWRDGHAFFTSEDDPYLAILVMCILRCDDLSYDVIKVEETVSSSYLPSAANMDGVPDTDQVKAWRVRLKIPHALITETSDLLDVLVLESAENPTTANYQLIERVQTAVGLTPEGSTDPENPTVYEGLPTTTGEYWYTKTEVFGGTEISTTYLRTSLLTSTTLNVAEKLRYFLTSVDTGYKKVKAKWYEVVIAIVIIVISIWAAQPAGVKAGAVLLGLSGAYVAVVVVAVTITVAALYMSLAALALSYLGAQNVAMALGQFLRTVAPLVQIASVISIISSIYGVIRKGIQQAAVEAARQGTEASLRSLAANVAVNAMEAVTGLTKLSSLTMAHVAKMLSFTFDIYQDMESRDLQRELNNYRREIASLTESKEKSETSDVVKELMSSYTSPLASDWSYYSEIYDRPYEWWSTPYHTGNMQATTVNALWLNDPQNAILYNNFTGDS